LHFRHVKLGTHWQLCLIQNGRLRWLSTKSTVLLCPRTHWQLEGHSVQRITSDKGRYPTAQLICVFVVLDLDLWPWASTTYSALPCHRRHLCTKFRQNLPYSIIWVKSGYRYLASRLWSVSLPKLNAVFRDSQAIHSQNFIEIRPLLLTLSALQFWVHVRIQDPDSIRTLIRIQLKT